MSKPRQASYIANLPQKKGRLYATRFAACSNADSVYGAWLPRTRNDDQIPTISPGEGSDGKSGANDRPTD